MIAQARLLWRPRHGAAGLLWHLRNDALSLGVNRRILLGALVALHLAAPCGRGEPEDVPATRSSPESRQDQRASGVPVSAGGSRVSEFKDRTYLNYMYGFALTLPEAIAVNRDTIRKTWAHGTAIELGSDEHGTRCVVSVYAQFDEAKSADEVADFSLKAKKREGGEITVRGRQSATLGSLPAVRMQLLRLKQGDAGLQETIYEIVKAVRVGSIGRSYSLTLVTVASRYEQDVRLFDELLQSWQILPLPQE